MPAKQLALKTVAPTLLRSSKLGIGRLGNTLQAKLVKALTGEQIKWPSISVAIVKRGLSVLHSAGQKASAERTRKVDEVAGHYRRDDRFEN